MRQKNTKLLEDRRDGAATRDERSGSSHSPGPLEAEVARNVLNRLGTPPKLYRVVVRHVAHRKYRANVFISTGAGISRVAHSFFIDADADGKIIESSPAIARTYGHSVE
jgi:hypothetical protein